MTNMKTNGLAEFDKSDLCKSYADDIPNLGSVITLDNKGRLINSQFSKPSSSQTLLKLNLSEEVPDADDLPYSVISYGDTPNAINLPYNDHNYIGTPSSKTFENYDKKALEYTSKQTIQYSNRTNFPTPTNLRISHFGNFNSNCLSQNDFVNNRPDNIFFNEKIKPNNQFGFNQNVSNMTPIIPSKPLNNHQQSNGFLAKKQLLSNAIVINSNSVNKLKGMSVIKLQRSNLDSINDPRIINVPINKPAITNVIANDSGTNEMTTGTEKSDKTINLIPRCICGFIHDDGGMIRCEICQTWQHIVCMYPDNKFPILYKCEKCEPREIDYKRAISTQTNNLMKAGHNPTDFLVNQEYSECESDNNIENKMSKPHTPQYVIVQPEMKASFRYLHESVHNSQNQIYITNSKDAQLVPPGSPRTSKRKQDLISLKTVLTKPVNAAAPGSFTVNNIFIHNKNANEMQKPIVIENQMNYLSNYLIPTSTNQVPIEQRELSSFSALSINEMSMKLKSMLCNKVQLHSNLSMQQEQYLRQNNSIVHANNNYQVIRVNFNQHVIKSTAELNCNEIVLEYNGFISLSEEYNKDSDYRKHYNPYVLFYDKCDHLPLCIDAKDINSDSKYIRRSCTPNAEVKHKWSPNGQIRFFITPINRISKDMEITIGFDYNYMKCRYQVECACNQPSCELIYMRMEEARVKKAPNIAGPITEYDSNMFTAGTKPFSNLTRPHKKRGRASKILNTSNRQTVEKPILVENAAPVVRRNKRGRPPLNRPNGIQRSDVCLKASSDSSSNNCLTEFKEASDNDSVHCRTNENIHPSFSLHSNFKNFKRISSSHWSLKAHRKLYAAKNPKPNKKLTTSKVGRPLKYKKEKLVETKKEIDFSSDAESSPERYNGTDRSYNVDAQNSSNEEYERNVFQYSQELKHEMSREEEGKYWLEEINNKIYKQKLKEAKKVKRKNRLEKKLSRKLEKSHHSIYNPPEVIKEPDNEAEMVLSQQECDEETVNDEENEEKVLSVGDTTKDKKASNLISNSSKTKRGRKSLKNNKNYIVSYKTSNIDDLKNDLMLISASLKEDPDQDQDESVDNDIKVKEEQVNIEYSSQMEPDENDRHFSDSLEIKKSETESDFGNKFVDSSDEKTSSPFKSKHRKFGSGKCKDNAKDSSKASREDRWVSIMWQRILKNENSDNKSKRKRSKSSFADESNPSEENPIECNDLSSPKFGDSDFCDDNLSCDNKDADSCNKSSITFKNTKRKANKIKFSTFINDSDKLRHDKLQCSITSEGAMESKMDNSMSDENENKTGTLQSNEQCGLIVYKEQQSNPMEKFSRENSAKLFSDNYMDPLTGAISNSYHPPHAKKRWLSQALLEENLGDVKSKDMFIDKFSAIETNSKHSFLPPIITSAENNAFSLTPQKIAMNPKKRLLNQFSMEDNAFRISSADVAEYKSSKWTDQSIDQEQSKTKLTLSEYRKRRFCDKPSLSSHDVPLKIGKSPCDGNMSEWVGLNEKFNSPLSEDKSNESKVQIMNSNCSSIISPPNVNRSFLSATETAKSLPNDSTDSSKSTYLSYINTLNNLKMPRNLDPRLTKSMSLINAKYLQSVQQSETQPNPTEHLYSTNILQQLCPRSPSKSPNSESDWRMVNDRGPRTPSDIDELSINPVNGNDCLSTYAASQASINSFESQPSPTSDSHFDLDKSDHLFYDTRKSTSICDLSASNDWTNHPITIGKMAGIQNPELLQEIEEFDDEYVPLPEKLPERSKEEMETLLLTQKRDSQIREWQEVKQLEREKVKLEHQVRSMQRRMQRVNKNPDVMKMSQNQLSNDGSDNKMGDSFVTATLDDEKTMKTFNVQLSNFNDRLIEQINILKNNKSIKTQAVDLPLSYRLQDDPDVRSTACDDIPDYIPKTSYKYKKKPYDKTNSQKLQSDELFVDKNASYSLNQSLNGPKDPDIPNTDSITLISDHHSNFKTLCPEMTSSFM